jgi:hypothetical protein
LNRLALQEFIEKKMNNKKVTVIYFFILPLNNIPHLWLIPLASCVVAGAQAYQ